MVNIQFLVREWEMIELLYELNHPGCIRSKSPGYFGNYFPVKQVTEWFGVWSLQWVQLSLEKPTIARCLLAD